MGLTPIEKYAGELGSNATHAGVHSDTLLQLPGAVRMIDAGVVLVFFSVTVSTPLLAREMVAVTVRSPVTTLTVDVEDIGEGVEVGRDVEGADVGLGVFVGAVVGVIVGVVLGRGDGLGLGEGVGVPGVIVIFGGPQITVVG